MGVAEKVKDQMTRNILGCTYNIFRCKVNYDIETK